MENSLKDVMKNFLGENLYDQNVRLAKEINYEHYRHYMRSLRKINHQLKSLDEVDYCDGRLRIFLKFLNGDRQARGILFTNEKSEDPQLCGVLFDHIDQSGEANASYAAEKIQNLSKKANEAKEEEKSGISLKECIKNDVHAVVERRDSSIGETLSIFIHGKDRVSRHWLGWHITIIPRVATGILLALPAVVGAFFISLASLLIHPYRWIAEHYD